MGKLKKVLNLRLYGKLYNYARPYGLIVLLIVILQTLTSALSVGFTLVFRSMIDLAVQEDFGNAVFFLTEAALLYLLNTGLTAVNASITVRYEEKMTYRIQNETINRLFKSKWLLLNRYHSEDIMTRLTSDAGHIITFLFRTFPILVAMVVQLVLAFITLYYFDRTLALFAFVLGPISMVITILLGKRMKRYQHGIQQAESRCRARIQEAVYNVLIVKTFNYERETLGKISKIQREKYKWSVKKSNYTIFSNIILSSGYWIGYIAALTWGAYELSRGLTSFGTFTAFVQLIGQIQGPFNSLARIMPQIVVCLTSLERLDEIGNIQTENTGHEPVAFKDGIERISFRNVTFGYVPGRTVLKGLSFDINWGDTVAIIGVSGEGKTTILRLLLSLIEPDAGEIFLSFQDGSTVSLSPRTRNLFAYVPQGNTMFSGTIRENLLVGNEKAGKDEIDSALRISCSWEFISGLPEGIDTAIGESGLGLSEGQAQRLAIARALLRKPRILLLDEATSALDIRTERAVLENIKKMTPKVTCIAVTHRLSVVDICDRVFRIADGKLTEHNVKAIRETGYHEACPADGGVSSL